VPNSPTERVASFSPPFALSATPPFAVAPQRPSSTLSRPPSVPQQLNIFPPSIPGFSPDRFGTSPSSLQTGALARALTNTAIRLIGNGANTAATAFARAAAKRRPTIVRTGEIDPAEDEVLRSVEDVARKAFVLFELADTKLVRWEQLARNQATAGTGTTPPLGHRRSSGSFNSDIAVLRQQVAAASEAVVLYCKALAFIVQGTNRIQRYWETRQDYDTSAELNGSELFSRSKLTSVVQWLRARFNEVYEKADWAKQHCAEELPFVDRLLHDCARDIVCASQ
jgi:serine/threonine-protein kinase ULK/ATG1